jgi:nicotinamidase-related amidase
MPISQLDPKAALILIDLQKGIVSMATAHPAAEIVERSARLAQAFRERGLPVVLVHVTGPPPGRIEAFRPPMKPSADWSELVPELNQQTSDIVITKQRWGAFIATELNDILRKHGVTQVVIAGISTSAGVESTARSAYDYGFNVALVTDAMTDRDAEIHRFTVDKIFPRLGEIDSTTGVLKLLRG